jgi:nickel-type superoxide dismutase maturation protease
MENELPLADEREEKAYLDGLREIFLIEGDSMFPVLKHGELVLFDPYAEPSAGDIVLARHPFKKSVRLVKRVREITDEGKYFLVGDNPLESSDSRSFGAIPAKDILGVAVCRLK